MYSAEQCGTGRGADYIRGEEGQQGGGAECRFLTSGCFLWAKSSAAGAGNETVMVQEVEYGPDEAHWAALAWVKWKPTQFRSWLLYDAGVLKL